jgi:hypothetical protein
MVAGAARRPPGQPTSRIIPATARCRPAYRFSPEPPRTQARAELDARDQALAELHGRLDALEQERRRPPRRR